MKIMITKGDDDDDDYHYKEDCCGASLISNQSHQLPNCAASCSISLQ